VIANPEPWIAQGACHGLVETIGPRERDRLFFPSRGEPTKRAKAMCADCPVRQECLDHALREGIHYGIWGGTSERERRTMRRELGITAPPTVREIEAPRPCPECGLMCASGTGLAAHRKSHARAAVAS
jgi:WhiB family redox-sensing transcriptional regulator